MNDKENLETCLTYVTEDGHYCLCFNSFSFPFSYFSFLFVNYHMEMEGYNMLVPSNLKTVECYHGLAMHW